VKILFAASEVVPFCKTGGLADVAGALSLALKAKRQDVRVVLPKYRSIRETAFGLKPLDVRLSIPLGDETETVRLWAGKIEDKVPAYFIDAPKYFDRDNLYIDAAGKDFPDNDDRFILFSRAVLETAKALDFRPDIFHGHDWQTGLVPAYLATLYKSDAFFLPAASVFTVHNIAYQGVFPKNALFAAGFSWADFTPDGLEFYGQINFLKAGLVYAHALNTVSPAYAKEIQSDPAFGRGMEGLLQKRRADLFGILNGIDTKRWDPSKDPLLPHRYSAKDLAPRALNKASLQRALGFREDPRAPLLGMVSRVDPQKGFDLAVDAVPGFLKEGAQLAILGSGDKAIEASLRALAAKFPGQVSFSTGFNEALAHHIYAGADIFLMPSKFEPCGLGQMIALLYGAVPVVTATGGLLDTVPPARGNEGLGFVAASVSPPGLIKALGDAIALYRGNPAAWHALQKRGMASRFGWTASVYKYLDLYRLALARKKERESSPA